MQEGEIKSLSTMTCPHCKEDIIVEVVSNAPVVKNVYSVFSLIDAKKEAEKKVKMLDAPEDLESPLLEWINDKDTVFTPDDVQGILNELIDKIHNSK